MRVVRVASFIGHSSVNGLEGIPRPPGEENDEVAPP